MINDLRDVFFRSLKIIVAHPRIIHLSVSLFALNILLFLGRISDLACLKGILSLGSSVFGILLQIYFILYVYKVVGVFGNDINVWTETRKYFWKTVVQFATGLLASTLIFLPFLLLIIRFGKHNKSLGAILLVILFYAFGYISLGTISLSQRVLLDENIGVLANLWEGVKNLSDYRGYYFLFFVITSLITTSLFWGFGILGSMSTSVDLFSVPVIPVFPFLRNYSKATSPFIIQLIMQFVYVFVNPYLSMATTLAYLKRKNYAFN